MNQPPITIYMGATTSQTVPWPGWTNSAGTNTVTPGLPLAIAAPLAGATAAKLLGARWGLALGVGVGAEALVWLLAKLQNGPATVTH
jgi:hypothetical protein